ncbi:hypothetical protein DENIS_1180 [Desulfonema ishimotonii]|uniref:Uncharacterized protein n=1 Tax=Desulfonema ishimotonii TaxID=45657 RepID=A0A401FTD7_9BACT|nr:hypothetical protein [Desulfonema ishimotonii]GBC60229.1 hypothetical protein DENIS_1180 [Desulfonema ishimotonii]
MSEYNQKAVDAIYELENTINSLGIPIILVRKLKGICNAIEMQVEDCRAEPEVIEYLCKAYLAQAKGFREPYRGNIIKAFQKCEKVIKNVTFIDE